MLNKNECTIIIYSYFAVCNGRHNALRYSNSLLKYKVYEVNSKFITRYKYVCARLNPRRLFKVF